VGRDRRADWLKAAAIVAVVFIHAPGPPGPYTAALRFCVPAFVALWAYYFELGLARRAGAERRAYVRSRFVRLLIPYAVWTAVYFPSRHTLADVRGASAATVLGEWLGGAGWPGQYFLIILFQLLLVAPLISRFVGRGVVWALLLGGLAGYPLAVALWDRPAVHAAGDRLFVYWLPHVGLGIGLARGYLPRVPVPLLTLIAVGALAAAPFELQAVAARVPEPSPYLLVSVYVGSIALVWSALAPRRAAEGGAEPEAGTRAGAAAGYVGQHTFAIFLTNPLVLSPFYLLLPSALIVSPAGLAVRVGATLAAVAGCLLVARTFRRMGLGRLIGE
jgi:peptidoglycan/LPS O-acetylase OafA/YrhL